MPLGSFIDKSKEAKVCGGARAVCLCSSNIAKAKSNEGGKIELTRSTAASTQKAPSGGANHQYLSPQKHLDLKIAATFSASNTVTVYELLLVRSIEHIPNA